MCHCRKQIHLCGQFAHGGRPVEPVTLSGRKSLEHTYFAIKPLLNRVIGNSAAFDSDLGGTGIPTQSKLTIVVPSQLNAGHGIDSSDRLIQTRQALAQRWCGGGVYSRHWACIIPAASTQHGLQQRKRCYPPLLATHIRSQELPRWKKNKACLHIEAASLCVLVRPFCDVRRSLTPP